MQQFVRADDLIINLYKPLRFALHRKGSPIGEVYAIEFIYTEEYSVMYYRINFTSKGWSNLLHQVIGLA